jgi:hypothetical protein
MEILVKAIGATVLVIVMFIGLSTLYAIPTYLLWNSLGPELFGFKTISLWQAWEINVLCAFLFKSTSESPTLRSV